MPEIAATGLSTSSGNLLNLLHVSREGDGLLGRDEHVELGRLVAVGAELDLVAPAVQRQLLERAVELVHEADVIAVDVDLRVARLDLQLQVALIVPAVDAARIRAVSAAVVVRIGIERIVEAVRNPVAEPERRIERIAVEAAVVIAVAVADSVAKPAVVVRVVIVGALVAARAVTRIALRARTDARDRGVGGRAIPARAAPGRHFARAAQVVAAGSGFAGAPSRSAARGRAAG